MASSIDKIVGQNVRAHRVTSGLSQSDLARKLGLSFQQVQKYESGANRIGSGRLWEIAQILGVEVIELYAGLEGHANETSASALSRAAYKVGHHFDRIRDERVRVQAGRLIYELGRAGTTRGVPAE